MRESPFVPGDAREPRGSNAKDNCFFPGKRVNSTAKNMQTDIRSERTVWMLTFNDPCLRLQYRWFVVRGRFRFAGVVQSVAHLANQGLLTTIRLALPKTTDASRGWRYILYLPLILPAQLSQIPSHPDRPPKSPQNALAQGLVDDACTDHWLAYLPR
jgi:hypothetical protein